VEIKLKKAQPYQWGDLEGSAATAAGQSVSQAVRQGRVIEPSHIVHRLT
jgi:hypothetical protein